MFTVAPLKEGRPEAPGLAAGGLQGRSPCTSALAPKHRLERPHCPALRESIAKAKEARFPRPIRS
eukprot:11806309-Alexandrium_andersonii.AAC.1